MNPNVSIGWRRKRTKKKITAFLRTEEIGAVTPALTALEEFEPIVYGAKNAKEKLVALLQLAAEIEHVLMVQYLYTMFTVINTIENPVENPVDNNKYVKSLKIIAIQEMGHFISVQNILVALEGINGVHLHKDILRPNSQKKPLPFSLERLSKDVLAKYTAIEMPVSKVTDPKFSSLVKHVADLIQMKPNPVGIIYTKVLNLLKDESISFSNTEDIQSEKEFWGTTAMDLNGAILEIIGSSEAATKLANHIAEQGEGPDNDPQTQSHFEIFFDLYDKFQPEDETQKKIAINPALQENPEFPVVTLIRNEYSKLWVNLFNQVYCSLLFDIYGSLLTKPISRNKYAKRFSSFAHANMLSSHKEIGTIIFDLPIEISPIDKLDLSSGNYCGPSYEIPLDFEPKSKIDLFITQVLAKSDEIGGIIVAIKNHKYFNDHVLQRESVAQILENILNDIKTRINLLNKLKNEQA